MKLMYFYALYVGVILLYFIIQFSNHYSNRFLYGLLVYQAVIVVGSFLFFCTLIRSELGVGLKILGYMSTLPALFFFVTALLMNMKIQRRLCPNDIADFAPFSAVTKDNTYISGIMKAGNHDRAVIIAHGVAAGKSDCQLLILANKLSKQYDVYLFDFRGYGQSQGTSTFGNLEIMDLKAVFDFAFQHNYSSICIIGNSMGGMVAVRLAAQDTRVDTLILVGTPASFVDPKGGETRVLSLVLDNPVGQRIYRVFTQIPISDSITGLSIQEKLLNSPINLIGKLSHIPVLIIHGKKDRNVSAENAYLLFSCAQQPKDLILYEDGGHGITDLSIEFGDTFRQTLLDWLDRNTRS